MTSPIHHFVLEGNTPHHKLTTQYRNDLQETWFFKKKDEIERHQKARIFQGRLYELICAEWLEQQGWEISNLEALGGGSDIEGKNSNGLRSIVEVKYFGQHDDIFKAHLNLEITRLSPYDAVNYLLYRIWEAAQQLAQSNKDKLKKRLVIIIFSNQIKISYETQISDNWISWNCPQFLNGSQDWDEWINDPKKAKISPNLEDLPNQIDEIQILVETQNFELTNIKTVSYSA